MVRITLSPEVASAFPGIAVAWVEVAGLTVAPAPAPAAEALKRAAEADVRASRTVERLKEDALFRSYRDFYWRLGIDPTKTRPSGEALNRRVLNGNPLPAINAFVDAYNAASLRTGISIGAYDLARLEGDLTLRRAREGEPFQGLTDPEPRPLKGGETVLADGARVVNFYPYRDALHTRITEGTRAAVLVACGAPGIAAEALREAAALAARHVQEACGGAAGDVQVALAPALP